LVGQFPQRSRPVPSASPSHFLGSVPGMDGIDSPTATGRQIKRMDQQAGKEGMKISISATNPCHLYPLAVELNRLGTLGTYYSGYPRWKLPDPIPMLTSSLRTNLVYAALKFLPEGLRPSNRHLFRWQDLGFDRWVGQSLAGCDQIHAMPGQCLRTFERARQLGIHTVMNHATGPVREWVKLMRPEYERVGLKLEEIAPYDESYFEQEAREYELADSHCVASSVVRDQLVDLGIPPERIRIAPYGADERIFYPAPKKYAPEQFLILFAGQIGLRKGISTLLQTLQLGSSRKSSWEMHFYGPRLGEGRYDLDRYRGSVPLKFFGAVSQVQLAEAFRRSSVLVLPSLEEGFGLVVPQALNCGLPCIVSDRVGAKDLIEHRVNGSIFESGNPKALLNELHFWQAHADRIRAPKIHDWKQAAERLSLPYP